MTFESFLNQKHKGYPKSQKVEHMNGYLKELMTGKGLKHTRKTGKALIAAIHKHGGSYGHNQNGTGFFDWIKRTASNIYHKVLKPVGNAAYNHVIKPAYEYARDKPLTAISKVAGLASMAPTPFSGILKGVATAAGAAGQALGKGMKVGHRHHRVGIMTN